MAPRNKPISDMGFQGTTRGKYWFKKINAGIEIYNLDETERIPYCDIFFEGKLVTTLKCIPQENNEQHFDCDKTKQKAIDCLVEKGYLSSKQASYFIS